MERFGLGYADLAVEQPGLVYASVTGFGRGAGAGLPGYDFLVQAVGGLMSVTGDADGAPTKVGVALVDVLAGQNLATGILAALLHRERTGRGQRVEVDLLSSLLAGLVNQASAYLNAGVVPGRLGNAHPSIAPYQTLDAADRPMVVAVGNDGQFAPAGRGPRHARRCAGRRGSPPTPPRVRHARGAHGRTGAPAGRAPGRVLGRPPHARPASRVGWSTPSPRRSPSPSRSGWTPWSR